MATEKKSITLPSPIIEAMGNRDEFLSTAVTRSLSRYLYALNQARRKLADLFSDDECALILDALNGSAFYDSFSINLVPHSVADSIELDGLDRKWNVAGGAVMEKLTNLSHFERMALVDAVQVWWNRTGSGQTPPFGDLFKAHPDRDIEDLLIL